MRSGLRRTIVAAWLGLAVAGALPGPALGVTEPEVFVRLAFRPGCAGAGFVETVDETEGEVDVRERVVWDAGREITVGGGGSIEHGDRVVVRLLSDAGRLLFSAPVPFIEGVGVNGYSLPDYLLLVRLDCSAVPYRVVEHLSWDQPKPAAIGVLDRPRVGSLGQVVLAFAPGCRGRGTLELVNESRPRSLDRLQVAWSPEAFVVLPIDGPGIEPGDRLVARLVADDGRLLGSWPLQFLDQVIVNGHRLPDYLLRVSLDCSAVPYAVTSHLSWNVLVPIAPAATDTAPPAEAADSAPAEWLALLAIGAAVGVGWVAVRRRGGAGARGDPWAAGAYSGTTCARRTSSRSRRDGGS